MLVIWLEKIRSVCARARALKEEGEIVIDMVSRDTQGCIYCYLTIEVYICYCNQFLSLRMGL